MTRARKPRQRRDQPRQDEDDRSNQLHAPRSAPLQAMFGNQAVQELAKRTAATRTVGKQNGTNDPGQRDAGDSEADGRQHESPDEGRSLQGGGRPLDPGIRSEFEPWFDHDFDGVRIHTGRRADAVARSIDATAVTVNEHMLFARGAYRPHTDDGEALLAHELTHVIQQDRGPSSSRPLRLASPREESEQEASKVAATVRAGDGRLRQTAGSTEAQNAAVANDRKPSPLPSNVVSRQGSGTADDEAIESTDLSGLRTIAQNYTSGYYSAANDALSRFERDMADGDADWATLWTNVAFDTIFAASVFASGGTAFVVNLSKVAIDASVSAGDIAESDNPLNKFIQGQQERIDDVYKHLNNEVDRVTREVYQLMTTFGWGDNRTRWELLIRLVKPEFITVFEGGLPNLDEVKVSGEIRKELLLQASQLTYRRPGSVVETGPSVFEQVWTIRGAIKYTQYPFSPRIPDLRPVHEWFYGIESAMLVNVPGNIEDPNTALNDAYRQMGRPIDPTEWDMEKRLVLDAESPFYVTYYLTADNDLDRWRAPSELIGLLRVQGHDPDTYLRRLLRMIQGHAGNEIPTVPRLFGPGI